MRYALACYGTRGDVEPSVSVGRELQRRGHDVTVAVPPELIDFAETAGLETVAYGRALHEFLSDDFLRNFWSHVFRNPAAALQELWRPIVRHWGAVGTTLRSLADGADLLSTGINFEQASANVAEHYGIPLATLHHFPMRPNGRLIPALPAPLVRGGGAVSDWLFWRATRDVDNAQRRSLGLPPATTRATTRITRRGALEVQAYDEVCVPGLASEWARWGDRRPFVGALTMELDTSDGDEVTSWIASGEAPVCFATGSIPLESPSDTIEMIASASAELGQRALVCAGGTDFGDAPLPDHVKVVGFVNYATVFAACRAVVHHGGSGTTAASLRAGKPTLILWSTADQPYWGNQLKRLRVGVARRFSKTDRGTLVEDLRRVLAPECATNARELATRMSTPAQSIAATADLFEAEAARGVRPRA